MYFIKHIISEEFNPITNGSGAPVRGKWICSNITAEPSECMNPLYSPAPVPILLLRSKRPPLSEGHCHGNCGPTVRPLKLLAFLPITSTVAKPQPPDEDLKKKKKTSHTVFLVKQDVFSLLSIVN